MAEPGRSEIIRTPESPAPIDRGFGTLAKPPSREEPNRKNEDSVRVTPFGVIVADGVGSAYRSDEVSKRAVQAVAEYTIDLPLVTPQNIIEERLHASVARADEDIRDFMRGERSKQRIDKSAGTTLIAAQYSLRPSDKQPQLTVLQIGDCELWALTPTDFIRLDRPDNQLWNSNHPDREELQRLFDEGGQRAGMFQDIARYFKGRFSVEEIKTLHRQYNTPSQLNNRFATQYRVDTRPLPPGTLAIVAQTDGIRKGISPEQEARIIRSARSAQNGVDKILANQQAFAGDDATIGILELHPSKRGGLPRFALPTAAATAIAAAGLAWGLSGEPTPPPAPAAKIEDTRTTQNSTSSEKREVRPVYGDLELRRYIDGTAKITIGGPEGAVVRAEQPTNTEGASWPVTVSEIRSINGVRIDTQDGTATFVMDAPPVTSGRDPLKPAGRNNMGGTWIVVEAEINMAKSGEPPRWVKKDAYINVGHATEGAVEIFDRHGKPLDTSQSLPEGAIKKNQQGQRFDEKGSPIGIVKPG